LANEPRVEDLLATIRKAIDRDEVSNKTGETTRDDSVLARGSIREMRVAYEKLPPRIVPDAPPSVRAPQVEKHKSSPGFADILSVRSEPAPASLRSARVAQPVEPDLLKPRVDQARAEALVKYSVRPSFSLKQADLPPTYLRRASMPPDLVEDGADDEPLRSAAVDEATVVEPDADDDGWLDQEPQFESETVVSSGPQMLDYGSFPPLPSRNPFAPPLSGQPQDRASRPEQHAYAQPQPHLHVPHPAYSDQAVYQHESPVVPSALVPQPEVTSRRSFDDLAHAIMSRATNEGDFEDLTRDLLRSYLGRWLEDHLPQLVERVVREEIERVARRGE
jgi:uncharacterized protein